MVKSFEEAFSDRVRGTRVTDILSFGNSRDLSEVDVEYDHRQETPLAPHTYEALLDLLNATNGPIRFQSSYAITMSGHPRLHPSGRFVPNVHHDGVRFATKETAARDSYIIYRQSGVVKAGQILSIFYHQRAGTNGVIVEPFFAVNPYQSLSSADAIHDPYRRFPELDTQLYYNDFEDTLDVVSTSALVSHFASFIYNPEGIAKQCIVVRSLDRVSDPYLRTCGAKPGPPQTDPIAVIDCQ